MIRYSLLIIITLCFVNCKKADTTKTKNLSSTPNIIYIFTDDLGYGDIGAFGAMDIKTPNIDRLALEGIKFTDFYSASSVCSPSRAGLLTGRYPARMGVNSVFFPESFTGMPSEEITIAEMLKTNNYATGIVGKWHLGHRKEFLPLQQGFDSYFGIPYSNDMASAVYMRGNKVETFNVDQTQTTKIYTEESLKFIENHKNESFFLYLAHNQPHVPIYASNDFIGTSDRGLYGDVIQEIDWSVGQILMKLEKLNLLENTLIVFSSDNGPWLVMEDHGGSAGELREGKQFTFDGGMRVPTLAMWKGKIPSGIVNHELATQLDWLPTIANITNSNLPKNISIDGKNISNVLFNTGKRNGDSFLFFNAETVQGFRKGDYKYKKPFKGFPGAIWKKKVTKHDTLLFHIIKDPGERNNLFPHKPELTRAMIKSMDSMYKTLGSLPASLVTKSSPDNSHYIYLENKNSPNK